MIKARAICKLCKWYPRALNWCGDCDICNMPKLTRQNPIDGKPLFAYCCTTNKEGDCMFYQKRDKMDKAVVSKIKLTFVVLTMMVFVIVVFFG